MALPALQSEPCDCPAGCCAAMGGDNDRGQCVNRYQEGCEIGPCAACGAHTWHHQGDCLRCRERTRREIAGEPGGAWL